MRWPIWIAVSVLSGACSAPHEAALDGELAESVDVENRIQAARTYETQAVYVVLEGQPLAEVWLSSAHRSVEDRARIIARHRDALVEQQESVSAALVQLGAEIVGRHYRLANAIQILVAEDRLRSIAERPDVLDVEPVTLFAPANHQASILIGANDVWGEEVASDELDRANAHVTGEGVTVAIIDSGVDYLHADFGGPGTTQAFQANDETIVEPDSFPTDKVVGGWDFVGNDYNPWGGGRSPKPDGDPIDCGGHGTHVAGTVAGFGVRANGTVYDGSYHRGLGDQDFEVGPGMAPLAKLYALKVFGCDGPTEMVAGALERASDPNQDDDFSDRVDVINASLGAGYGLGSATERKMTENIAALGTVVVAAAGNDGSDGRPYFSVGAPAVYPGALSVAATLNRELEFAALEVESPPSVKGVYPIAEGDFSQPLSGITKLSAINVVRAKPILGCSGLDNAAQIKGKIALIRRGDCYFRDKAANAVAAGAVAAVIIDNVDADTPFSMSGAGSRSDIPVVMIRHRDGERLLATEGEMTISLGGDLQFPETLGPDYVASFSSRGPSSLDGGMKPEISAPGNSLTSARVGSGTSGRRMSGTSMASPVVAGAAALAVEAHPDYTPREIKALLMGTAAPVTSFGSEFFPISLSGAGRIQVDAAVSTRALAYPETGEDVGLSFGVLDVHDTWTEARVVVVDNRGETPVTFDVSHHAIQDTPGVTLELDPESFTLEPGASERVTARLHVDARALPAPRPDSMTPLILRGSARHYVPELGGWIRFTDADGDSHAAVAYQAVVRAAGELSLGEASLCEVNGETEVQILPAGSSPMEEQWSSVFPLVAEDPEDWVRAVGVTSNVATQGWEKGLVYFGVALTEEWTTPVRGQLPKVRLSVSIPGGRAFSVEPVANSPGNEGMAMQGAELYADVLVARLFSADGNRLSDQPLNAVSPDVSDTRAFFSNVLVFPVRLKDLGMSEDSTTVRVGISRSTSGLFFDGNAGPFSVDLAAPAFPVAEESPVHAVGSEALRLLAAPGLDLSVPQSVLLLHHGNRLERRAEVLDINLAELPHEGGNLSVSSHLVSSKLPSARHTVMLNVSNDSELPRAQVWLEVKLSAGWVNQAVTRDGRCAVEDFKRVKCQFGNLAAGESVTAQLMLEPRSPLDAIERDAETAEDESSALAAGEEPEADVSAGDASDTEDPGVSPEELAYAFDAEVGSQYGCDTVEEDNHLRVTSVVEPQADGAEVGRADGVYRDACGCRTVGARPVGAPVGWLAAGVFALLALGRRRSRGA